MKAAKAWLSRALLSATLALAALMTQCTRVSTQENTAAGVGVCGSISGTLTLQTSSGTLTLPANDCLSYGSSADRISLQFCANEFSGQTVERQICAEVGLVTPYTNKGQGTFSLQPWAWDDPLLKDGVTQFLAAQLTDGNAYAYAAGFINGSAPQSGVSTDYPGSGTGSVTVANASFPYYVGDSGQAQLDGANIELSGGATLSFSLAFGLSVSAGTSGGTSGGAGASSAGSSGGESGSGGSCPCEATAAPSYDACNTGGDIAACDCAAAYLDNCGIQNAAAGCCSSNQSSCISQLQSDCQSQLANALALASPGVAPECSSANYPCSGTALCGSVGATCTSGANCCSGACSCVDTPCSCQ